MSSYWDGKEPYGSVSFSNPSWPPKRLERINNDTKSLWKYFPSTVWQYEGRARIWCRAKYFRAVPCLVRGTHRESRNPSWIQEPMVSLGSHHESRNLSWIQESIVTPGTHRESTHVWGKGWIRYTSSRTKFSNCLAHNKSKVSVKKYQIVFLNTNPEV